MRVAFPTNHQFIFRPKVISVLKGVTCMVVIFVYLVGLELELAEV
jgi:hypothetical protein